MQTQEMISIKANYNETEIRRFSMPVNSPYPTLEASIRTMFSLSGPLMLKYTDDEGDLCTITTQPELDFAFSLHPNLLRLQIIEPASIPLVRLIPIAAKPSIPDGSQQQNFKDHLEKKTSQLNEKAASLILQITETNDDEHKRQLSNKLQKVQQKLVFIESRKQRLNNQEKPWKTQNGEKPWRTQNTCSSSDEKEQRWVGFKERRSQALSEKHRQISLMLCDESTPVERRRVLDEKLKAIEEKQIHLENKKPNPQQHTPFNPNQQRTNSNTHRARFSCHKVPIKK